MRLLHLFLLALALSVGLSGVSDAYQRAGFVGRNGPVRVTDIGLLDFTKGVLDQRVTFTRASTGTYRNSSGVIATASANQPRFEYDASGNPLGLLIEGSETNIHTYSNDFSNASWVKSNSSVTTVSDTAPDGSTTAYKIVENASTRGHFIEQRPTVSNGSYTSSVYAKSAGRNWVWVFSASNPTQGDAWFDLQNGVVGTTRGNVVGAAIESVGNGWYRCSVTWTRTAGTGITLFGPSSADNTTSYTGDGSSGILVFGSQAETGSTATSYIPTTSSTATRAADVATVTDLSSIGYNQSEGTLYAEFDYVGSTQPNDYNQIIGVDNGFSTTSIRMTFNNTTPYLRGVVTNGGTVTMADNTANQIALSGALNKAAFAFSSTGASFSLNGGTVVTDSTISIPTVNTLRIGSGTAAIGGHIREVRVLPYAANTPALTQ